MYYDSSLIFFEVTLGFDPYLSETLSVQYSLCMRNVDWESSAGLNKNVRKYFPKYLKMSYKKRYY